MMKSYGNIMELFAEDADIEKAVMSIVTDSSGERPENVYAVHSLLRDKVELDKIYEENKGKYKDLKEELIEDLKKFIAPMREKRRELEGDRQNVLEILAKGGEVARERAEKKMIEVREKVGLKLS